MAGASISVETLAQFCIAQRNSFSPVDWRMRVCVDGELVGLAAKYLSMTSWYGHENELEQFVLAMSSPIDRSHLSLFHEAQSLGFDLPAFSVAVRIGITKARSEQQANLFQGCSTTNMPPKLTSLSEAPAA